MPTNQTMQLNDSTTIVNMSCFQDACRLNKSRTREEAAGSNPCGYCDVHCIYCAIECIFTVGIIANAVVVLRVARDRKLRNPTFVSIAACAAADMCLLILDFAVSYEAVILAITCTYPSRLRNKIYRAATVVARFSAYGHLTLLAIVRYVILVYPIKAKIYLTTRRVFLFSGLIWALGVLSSTSTGIISFIFNIPRRNSQEHQLAFWTTMYLAPVTTTVTLHLVKIYKIGRATTVTTNEQATRRVKAMSRMVLVVIFVATVLPFLFFLDRLLQTFGDDIYGSSAVSIHIGYISRLLVLSNHSINPVMYGFVSNAFRMSLKKMLGLNRNVANGPSNSNETPIATFSGMQRRTTFSEE